MMKKGWMLLIALMICFAVAPAAYAADFTLWINGSNPNLTGDTPYIKRGRVMVPLRLISESFGYDVTWQSAHRRVILSPANDRLKGKADLSLKIGEKTIYANEQARAVTDVPAEIRNNYTFVPLRVIAEVFGYPVRWDDSTRTAIIGRDEPVPFVRNFSAKNMNLTVEGADRGSVNAFAQGGRIYVRADQLAKALNMRYREEGYTFSDSASDLTVRLQAADGFSITANSRYFTSSDGFDFGRFDMNTYKIWRNKVYLPLGSMADAKHMILRIQGNRLSLVTDPKPDIYPVTILAYAHYTTRFLPSKSGMFIVWNGKNYVLKDARGGQQHFGRYMNRIFNLGTANLSNPNTDDAFFHRSFGWNNHFYLQRQAGMVIGGISD